MGEELCGQGGGAHPAKNSVTWESGGSTSTLPSLRLANIQRVLASAVKPVSTWKDTHLRSSGVKGEDPMAVDATADRERSVRKDNMAPIRIGAAQVPPTSDLDQNLAKTIEYMGKAAAEGVEILCFPETHIPGYRAGILDPEAPCDAIGLARAAAQVSASCRELSIGVVLGTETPNSGGKPFNSAIVMDQHGETIALSHKSKLTPNDALAYTAGPGPTMFTFKDIPMGVVICFEAFRFPETTRALAQDGATVVFHPQFNHVMPKMEWKLPVHEALLVTRAAENTLYFVSANMSHPLNNCRSLAIAPDGLIQEASVLAEEMLLVADVDPKLATHAFLYDDLDLITKALAELEVDPARTWG